MNLYARYFKRGIDVILSGGALLILSPIILFTGIFVRIKLGSPVLHTAERPGKNENIFKMYKFRTMTNEKDAEGNLAPDSVRLTKFGRILRSTSLDELPELVNILKGDMSIIGPRPLAKQYLPYYTEYERKRHSVRPGLSGLAQVSGRNSMTWEQRFKYDIEYVHNISFVGDVKIIFKTIKIALSRSDIGERGKDGLIDFDEYRKLQDKR